MTEPPEAPAVPAKPPVPPSEPRPLPPVPPAPPWRTVGTRRLHSVTRRGALPGLVVSLPLVLAIVSGAGYCAMSAPPSTRQRPSRAPVPFPYAVAAVHLAFGVVHRYTVRDSSSAAASASRVSRPSWSWRRGRSTGGTVGRGGPGRLTLEA
ncbi:hypothetical protein ACF08N_29265 [Streptomyces sp. NPDC015127]|uniref:hypothetical protein n=1 Tax=Streptomyces sp. NPDC015127 TaxID=3364939 RepID=UPI0036FBE92C